LIPSTLRAWKSAPRSRKRLLRSRGPLENLAEVHAIDTFVSADSTVESKRFADAILRKGPVLRASRVRATRL
jgi:hypothetical protein